MNSSTNLNDLKYILDYIIPADMKRNLPSGAHFTDLEIELTLLEQGLQEVNNISLAMFKQKFSDLNSENKNEVINIVRKKLFIFFNTLIKSLFKKYYQDPLVLKSIGLNGPSPFPNGNILKDTDFSILEKVYDRGCVYREVK